MSTSALTDVICATNKIASAPWSGSVSQRQRQLRLAVAAFGAASGVDLAAEIAQWNQWRGAEGLSRAAMWTLMPTLVVILLVAVPPPRHRQIWLTLVALGFSWLGDAIPTLIPGDNSLYVKLGFFLVSQIVYIVAFSPKWRSTLIYKWPGVLGVNLVGIAALVAICAPLGSKVFAPVLLYSICLQVMALLSTGTSKRSGVGGAIFLVSDALIALREFAPRFAPRAAGFWIMASYLVAQGLIVCGVAGANNSIELLSHRRCQGLSQLWLRVSSGFALNKK